MSKKEALVSKNCRDAINKLHETMKSLDLAEMDLGSKDKAYTRAISFLLIWIGLASAVFVAAATVFYSMGPITGIKPEHAFLNPEGGVYMNFTWFGLGLIVNFAFSLISFCGVVVCYLSYRAAGKKVKEINEALKDAKSAILEICPVEVCAHLVGQ